MQEDAFKTAYQSIIGVTISGLVDDELIDESQTPVLTVTYTFNNGTEPITVEYLPYDINNYCVRREGSVDLICKKDQVDTHPAHAGRPCRGQPRRGRGITRAPRSSATESAQGQRPCALSVYGLPMRWRASRWRRTTAS